MRFCVFLCLLVQVCFPVSASVSIPTQEAWNRAGDIEKPRPVGPQRGRLPTSPNTPASSKQWSTARKGHEELGVSPKEVRESAKAVLPPPPVAPSSSQEIHVSPFQKGNTAVLILACAHTFCWPAVLVFRSPLERFPFFLFFMQLFLSRLLVCLFSPFAFSVLHFLFDVFSCSLAAGPTLRLSSFALPYTSVSLLTLPGNRG